ncbi:hypothetical protein [Anditalea andensis]|uniref:Uncharacterized protein n=1 Tax=Anditalea andensis TaxID=1048983 RepID=A0A074L3Z6_9BACT|nr:hypothetical protein [Anditalea andensis]KEO74568.1 hypothetical protein EL17_02520 [Anditalea andensis]
MDQSKINNELLNNRQIFNDIHKTKNQFKEVFTTLSNDLSHINIKQYYPLSKGLKISMGNELEKCPYQVLDIFRNFDKKMGHNIRILNWWGHGLYILVFFGYELAIETRSNQKYFLHKGFKLTQGSSPWDYSNLANTPIISPEDPGDTIEKHIHQYRYLQWCKKIEIATEIDSLQKSLGRELNRIFDFHNIKI